uniref:Uncharacterized protein n=1 Tax=Anguilla anguilla TaxID=7936 RepID=A0A0E9PLH1_ANGAN
MSPMVYTLKPFISTSKAFYPSSCKTSQDRRQVMPAEL